MNWQECVEQQAKKHYPHECCGVLLGIKNSSGDFQIKKVQEMPNQIQGKGKKAHFKVDSLDLYHLELEIEKSGFEILGFYHSHPDCSAKPSKEDFEYMIPGLVYVIVSVTHSGVVDIGCYKKK